MKFEIMIGILFMLLGGRQVTAGEIAARFHVSKRTVYRYVDQISINVPIGVERGTKGGFFIADSFRLPATFLTEGEYSVVLQALKSVKDELPGDEVTSAMEKLSANSRAGGEFNMSVGNIVIDSGPWGVTADYGNKLKVLGECVESSLLASITYRDSSGRVTTRTVEPHVLVLKQGIWYMYAFCRARGAFRLFKVGRIENIFVRGGSFDKRPVDKLKEVLTYSGGGEGSVSVELKVDESALTDVEEWLGVECVERGDENIARAMLPENAGLVSKILSYGGRVEVLRPDSLKRSVIQACEDAVKKYRT